MTDKLAQSHEALALVSRLAQSSCAFSSRTSVVLGSSRGMWERRTVYTVIVLISARNLNWEQVPFSGKVPVPRSWL